MGEESWDQVIWPLLGSWVELSWVRGQIYCTVVDKTITKMDVDLSQWRATIGSFYSRCVHTSFTVLSATSCPASFSTSSCVSSPAHYPSTPSILFRASSPGPRARARHRRSSHHKDWGIHRETERTIWEVFKLIRFLALTYYFVFWK